MQPGRFEPKLKRRGDSASVVLIFVVCLLAALRASAAELDTAGVTLLRLTTTNLSGSGLTVAQVEAGDPDWQVNPAAVGQPASLFVYHSASGTANGFPNQVGSGSTHASDVGAFFYGLPAGVATNVALVDNYEANHFYAAFVQPRSALAATIVNQSFIVTGTTAAQQAVDQDYDRYAAQFKTLFISGVGNGGGVSSPGTCYNGIGVGAYGGSSSVGPSADNGRAKPDLTAPGSLTSYSTPLVSGAATLLLQAAARGDGGADTASATDSRTLKALLLNGAIKPADWAHPAGSPLDPRYGAGVLNVFNAYRQLTGGKQSFTTATTVLNGATHPPPAVSGAVPSASGWDFNTISSSAVQDGVQHYFFNVTNAAGAPAFTTTITLVWQRQANQSAINDLDLFLYDANSGSLIASSTSTVDNVEHLYLPALPAGRYDLQVFKNGGLTRRITNNETYALAFEFFNVALAIGALDSGPVVSWPIYPAGFVLETATGLNFPITWNAFATAPLVTNQLNRVELNGNGAQFFRLRRP